MISKKIIRDTKGISLTEVLVVMSIIGILAMIGAPTYSDYVAKSKVKQAANDLLQNARLARTLAIKENRTYVIAFNIGADSYSIGWDGDGNGTPDGFENAGVRTVNLRAAYGGNVVFGNFAPSVPTSPLTCPGYGCAAPGPLPAVFGTSAASPVYEQFNPDGSVSFLGSAYITHATEQFTYLLRTDYQSGKFDLWSWDGNVDIPAPGDQGECDANPVRICGWTEVR